ncbi:MAG: hypothetical protein QM820_08085 [Minicystis sp.]
METIAERTLEIELPGESEKGTIRVLVGKPQTSDGETWIASYEIRGPGPEELVKRDLYGADSMQALESVFRILPLELAGYERRGRLTCDGQPGSGFRESPEMSGPKE